jgi:hypothetical protein
MTTDFVIPNPHSPLVIDGPENTVTLVFSPVAVGSFARDGERAGVDQLYVGRYSKLHGQQWSRAEFTEGVARLRQIATRERLRLRCAHTYHHRGLGETIVRVGQGQMDGPRFGSREHASKRGMVIGQIGHVDITGLGSPDATIVELSAPDKETRNYGSFRPPMLELTIPKPYLMQALIGYAGAKVTHA